MDSSSRQKIRRDFDRIAALTADGWDHNSHYHSWLVSHLPERCDTALDIGCGSGAFSRLLAERCGKVISLDLSPKMLEAARKLSRDHSNIEYHCADIMTWDFPSRHFDCIVSIATLHHLPLREIMPVIKDALKPGGVLIVLDLRRDVSLPDSLWSIAAVPVNILLRLLKYRRLSEPAELRRAWEEHGKNETYLSMGEAREICSDLLAGAKLRKHLLWRYSIIWRKPLNP